MTTDPTTTDQVLPTRLAVVLAAQFGLDIVHAFPVQLFNVQGCPAEHALPDFGRASTLGVIVGNSNALWPAFLQHLASHPAALEAANPLDVFVEAAVTHAVTQCCQALQRQQQCPSDNNRPAKQQDRNGGVRCAIRFSHHTEPGRFVNMMRAAQLSGLAYYSSTTHLCMHPRYGPWFALRAVAVFDVDGPDPSAFTQLPCPHPDLEAQAAEQVGCRLCVCVPRPVITQLCHSQPSGQVCLEPSPSNRPKTSCSQADSVPQ